MPEIYAPGHLAVFRGMTPQPYELEVEVIAHDGSVALPQLGEFLLIGMHDTEAAVARVTHCFPCGPIATHQGETYLAEIGKSGTAIPEAVKKLVLRFTLRMQLLGRLQQTGESFRFAVGVRQLSQVGSQVRRPSVEALRYLCNVGLEDSSNASAYGCHPVPFGHLVLGDQEFPEVEIRFDINRLKARRTLVFARAGYGKSNLIKYLLRQLYQSKPEVGLLIIDPEGEYALPSARVPGLANHPALRAKLRLYTRRPVDPQFSEIFCGDVYLNFKDFTGREIVTAFVPPEKQTMVWANWVKSAKPEQWAALVDLFARKNWAVFSDAVREALGKPTKQGKEDAVGDAVINNLHHLVQRLHREESTLGRELIAQLRGGNIVIVDTSLVPSENGKGITELLLFRAFSENVRAFTSTGIRPVETIAVFEEAQTILGGRHFSEESIFVRWVKEGRKYGLGSILITQQPGAISEQILSQGDNFFVMHLLNQGDLEALQRVNAHYGPDILRQLRSEPIKGNCYFWSAPDQPYVLAARVHNFDQETQLQPIAQAEFAETPAAPSVTATPLPPSSIEPREVTLEELGDPAPSLAQSQREQVLHAIAQDPGVHVFESEGGMRAVSLYWLARRVELTEDALREILREQQLEIARALVNGRNDAVVLFAPDWCPLIGKTARDFIPLIRTAPPEAKTLSSTSP